MGIKNLSRFRRRSPEQNYTILSTLDKQIITSAISTKILGFCLSESKNLSTAISLFKTINNKTKFPSYLNNNRILKHKGKYLIHPYLPMYNTVSYERFIRQEIRSAMKDDEVEKTSNISYLDLTGFNNRLELKNFLMQNASIGNLVGTKLSKLFVKWDCEMGTPFQLRKILRTIDPDVEIWVMPTNISWDFHYNNDQLPNWKGVILEVDTTIVTDDESMSKIKNQIDIITEVGLLPGIQFTFNTSQQDAIRIFEDIKNYESIAFFIFNMNVSDLKNDHEKVVKSYFERVFLQSGHSKEYDNGPLFHFPQFRIFIEHKICEIQGSFVSVNAMGQMQSEIINLIDFFTSKSSTQQAISMPQSS